MHKNSRKYDSPRVKRAPGEKRSQSGRRLYANAIKPSTAAQNSGSDSPGGLSIRKCPSMTWIPILRLKWPNDGTEPRRVEDE